MPGSVEFADWTFDWSIPNLRGEGLVITNARYRGMSVLARASQPFVLVNYHGGSPIFKDGLNPKCGGRAYYALVPTAPNANDNDLPLGSYANNDNEYDPVNNPRGAVVVERMEPSPVDPAHVMIWSKFQVGNYQYIHRWEFRADGMVMISVGLGGKLYWETEGISNHTHQFYFRLDFDILTPDNNLVQRMVHQNNDECGDVWENIYWEAKQNVDLNTFTRWRVINKTKKPNGQYPGYDLVPHISGSPDGVVSTGDLWILRKGCSSQEDGSGVECDDSVLNRAVRGWMINGRDVLMWYCLRHHHVVRQWGEEGNVLPYHFATFYLQPRDFLDETPVGLYDTNPPSPF
ncbi:hypothetical protein [Brevibacillus dissolubilis]|uniref:copper amine oxidase n=1 Tax=Brevibacillus dissolubilis TaxID=1844116 RepID=UPI00159BB8BF|nr:hypothetical protein [Brevibacillus dissolubilis]